MTGWRAAVIATALALAPVAAWGQAENGRPLIWDIARTVLIDPTTYAPAVISHEAIRWDWKTSQILFAYGWVEENPRFTISGRANDPPVSYATGNRIIRGVALSVFQRSVANNLAVGIGERVLTARYPERKKLIRTLSWVERVAFAAIITYRNAADHVRQAAANRRLAREYAYTAQ